MFDDRYLSVEEMAKYLKVGRNTAYKLCKEPGFPSSRIGKKILIDKNKLDNVWMKNKQRAMNRGRDIRK